MAMFKTDIYRKSNNKPKNDRQTVYANMCTARLFGAIHGLFDSHNLDK